MPYPPLFLSQDPVSAVISMATEPHLQQAHYLLATTYSGEGPANHFGLSATVMTLLAIAAASRLRHFDLETNDKRTGDREIFVACVERNFPWAAVSLEDVQLRAPPDLRRVAALELYSTFRNPFLHIGGITSTKQGRLDTPHRRPSIAHVYPGLGSAAANEESLSEYCCAGADGDLLLDIKAGTSTLHTRPLYWCARKMIENLATCAEARRDIASSFRLDDPRAL
jgi:hypothetical protein